MRRATGLDVSTSRPGCGVHPGPIVADQTTNQTIPRLQDFVFFAIKETYYAHLSAESPLWELDYTKPNRI